MSVASRIFERIARAAAFFGYIVRVSASSDLTADPTITAGAGAASATEPNGSIWMRTNGPAEMRAASAWRTLKARVFSQVAASTAITGATETSSAFNQSYTFPANSMTVGMRIAGSCFGKHTVTTSTEVHTQALKLGSVVLGVSGNIDPADADYWRWEWDLKVRTVGASGTFVGFARLSYGTSAGAPTIRDYYVDSTAIDTTTTQLLAAFIDRQASATDGDSCRLDDMTVEVG